MEDFTVKPIGYIESVFKFKNGTPHQSGVCQSARAKLTISKSVFNNPEHSLEGLESFSHVWIVFWFHMNNNAYSKAKVKPPHLNGKKVGLYSSRSPYRPNPLGLTLAKLEAIQGSTLLLSGVDMLDGTPVVDIKPYVPQYDAPGFKAEDPSNDDISVEDTDEFGTDKNHELSADTPSVDKTSEAECTSEESLQSNDWFGNIRDPSNMMSASKSYANATNLEAVSSSTVFGSDTTADSVTGRNSCGFVKEQAIVSEDESMFDNDLSKETLCPHGKDSQYMCSSSSLKNNQGVRPGYNLVDSQPNSAGHVSDTKCVCDSPLPSADIATWISNPPISKLDVRFTVTAEQQLNCFSSENPEVKFRLCLLKNAEEAKEAISSILQADPRSTYRRKHCEDRLYYFTLDVLHITCWFDDCCAEVVRVKPTTDVTKLGIS